MACNGISGLGGLLKKNPPGKTIKTWWVRKEEQKYFNDSIKTFLLQDKCHAIVHVMSFIAFLFIILGLHGIKVLQPYGQRCIFLAQIFWFIDGILNKNWVLCIQSVYLGYLSLIIDYEWKKKGVYK